MKPTKPFYENFARQAIIEGLLSLMKKKPFDDISVTEIAAEAGIARRTFYIYYSTKQDVLYDYYAVLTREYDSAVPNDGKINDLVQYEYFFRFWDTHKEYLELLHSQGMLYILLHGFSGYMERRVLRESGTVQSRYVYAYSAGGLWSVLNEWVENGYREEPEELAQIVFQMQK